MGDARTLAITLFDEAGEVARTSLEAEAERIGRSVERELRVSVRSA